VIRNADAVLLKPHPPSSSPRTPGPITTNGCYRQDCRSSFAHHEDSWWWVPDRARGACHRAALCADPWLACPGRREWAQPGIRVFKHTFAFPRHDAPEACVDLSPFTERAQGKPGARCTRGLVCNGERRAHTSIQVQRRHPGFPCAMVYGLFRALPGDRLSCHRRLRM